MALNVELLERVKAHILEDPRRVHMLLWATPPGRVRERGAELPPCGTVACIGGTGYILAGETERARRLRAARVLRHAMGGRMYGEPVPRIYEAFGVPEEEDRLHELFHSYRWPRDAQERLHEAERDRDQDRYAAIVAERIDRFIAEHEEENPND